MKLSLIGCGDGFPESLTGLGREAWMRADLIIGSRRLLRSAGSFHGAERIEETRPEQIAQILASRNVPQAAVLYSGDTGFYSGASALLACLDPLCPDRMEVECLPGISSLQTLSARLRRPWQDWILCSAHGTACDPVRWIMAGKPVFFLTGGKQDPAQLCRALTEAGLGDLPVTVGENLGRTAETTAWENAHHGSVMAEMPADPAQSKEPYIGKPERITCCTAAEAAEQTFSPLSVLLTEAAPVTPARAPGIPDREFFRDTAPAAGGKPDGSGQETPDPHSRRNRIPLTRREIRPVILAKLGVTPGDVCWDIGAGCGGISVELALHTGAVWAVERRESALGVLRRNREKFRAWNLRVIPGSAPEALSALPAPDKVFVGGSGGKLREILTAVHSANPHAAVCVSAITLETLHVAVNTLEPLGYQTEITMLSVSHGAAAGDLHMMVGENPVFLITGTVPENPERGTAENL